MVFKHLAYQDEGIPNVYVAGSIDNYSNFKNKMSLMSTGITISLTTSYKGGQSIEQVYNIENKSTTVRATYVSSVKKVLYDELPQVFVCWFMYTLSVRYKILAPCVRLLSSTMSLDIVT